MARSLARPRKVVEKQLMRDTCTLQPLGGSVVSSICGIADPKRTPDQPLDRGGQGGQLQVKGTIAFRLPVNAPAMPLGSTIVYGGRTYAVVDPGAPIHSLMLARYVGCEEVSV